MRKISSILTLLLLCLCGNLSAENVVIARMAALAGAANNQNKATVSADWETTVEGGAVYEFSNGNYLGAISNPAVVNAIEGNKYVTVAMWVYGPTTSDQALFGYGDQGTGIKVSLNGNAQKMTTKDVADFDIATVNANNIQANQWCFVAFSFRGVTSTIESGEHTYRYYTSTKDGQFNSRSNNNLGNMNPVADASKLLAIGSGNQGDARDPYTGLIANLTVITSDGFLNNSALATLVGAAPTITTTGLRNLINTRIAYINQNKRDAIGYFTPSNANAAITAAQAAVDNESSTIDQLQEQLNALNALPINLPVEGKTYRIVSASPNYEARQGVKKAMFAGSETTSGTSPVTANVVRWGTASYTDNTYFWTIVPNDNGGYTIKNEATHKYMGVWGDPIRNRQILTDTPSSITLSWLGPGQFNIKNGSNVLHTEGHQSGAGGSNVIVGWNGGFDSYSAWYIEEETLCDAANITYRLMDGEEELWSKTIEAAVGKPYPAVTGFYNNFVTFNIPQDNVAGSGTIDITATDNFPFLYGATVGTAPIVALDVHGNEAKYPLYNNNGNLRVEYTARTNALDYTQGATKNNTYFWQIVGDPFRGFKIYNVSAQKFIKQTNDADEAVTLDETGTTFQVFNSTAGIDRAFCFKVPSRSNYINHRGEKLQGWTAADAGSSFRAYPITTADASYDLTLNVGYATLCVPFYANVPDGIKLYSNNSVDANGVLELTEIESPALIMPGKPYIVEAETSVNSTLSNTSILTSTETTHEGNLYGVVNPNGKSVPAGSYVLARNKESGKQAFFRTDGSVTCPQYKCYLTLPAAATAAKELYFDNEGATTGIEAIFGGENEEVVIYDLSGKRLSRLQKGVNIVNGHKVIVK